MASEGPRPSYSREMIETARRLRQDATKAGQRVWEIVRDRRCGGHRFQRQTPVGQYILDFYCAAVRLAIEIDGSIHNEPEVRERDQNRQTALEQDAKLTFLRLQNTEVLQTDAATLTTRILQAVEQAALSVPSWSERPARRR